MEVASKRIECLEVRVREVEVETESQVRLRVEAERVEAELRGQLLATRSHLEGHRRLWTEVQETAGSALRELSSELLMM
jgi:hypothetical protein